MPPLLPELRGVEHRFLDLSTGVRVQVAEAGRPDAPPALALHGWPQRWWCGATSCAAGGRPPPAVPGPARLRVERLPADGDFAKQRLAEDALVLLDSLGLERAFAIGHDWGGWTAILLGPRAARACARC